MGKTKPAVVLKQKNPDEPIPAEIIADSIVEIAAGMRRVVDTRLTRKAIVALIHEHSKVPRSTIETVLINLEYLETTWLKPRKN